MKWLLILTLAGCGTVKATGGKCLVNSVDGVWLTYKVCTKPAGDWRACACVDAGR